MPHYDYVCENCGSRFEFFQKITDKPKRKCPECAHYRLRREIGPGAAILFKGTGFYATDYRKSGKKGKKGDST